MTDATDNSGWLQRIKSGAEATLERAAELAGRQLGQFERRLEQLAPRLLQPDNVEQLQKSLSFVARTVYGLGFSADEDARRLFELFDWVEREHGRDHVVHALGRHNPLLDERFLALTRHLADLLADDSRARDAATRRLEAYRDFARREVLELLAQLASLESDTPVPDGDDEALADYVRHSGLPERFDILLDRTRGTSDDDPPAAESDDPAPTEPPAREHSSALERGIETLARRDSDVGALARRVAPLFDRQLRFLSTSFLFATQAFLTRTAIESLPDLADQSGMQPPDDVIDV